MLARLAAACFLAWLWRPALAEGFFAGPLVSDNSGLRGFCLAAEGTDVLAPAAATYSLGLDAANYLTFEQNPSGQVLQKFELQTLSLEWRRGLSAPLDLQASLRASLTQCQEGVLNGFINSAEHMLARMTGDPDFINSYRSGSGALGGTANQMSSKSESYNRAALYSARLGDTVLGLKAGLGRYGPAAAAARLVLNLPTGGDYTNGAYMGLGLSGDLRSGRLDGFLDVRGLAPLQASGEMDLPLNPASVGFTTGLEWSVGGLGAWIARFPERTSLGLQWNCIQTPYQPTGLRAFDTLQNDLTFGYSQGVSFAGLESVVQVWGREDFFFLGADREYVGLLPYAPPDFQAGVRVTLR